MYIVQFICKSSYCTNSDIIIVSQCNTILSSSTRLYFLGMKIFINDFQGSLMFHLHRKSPISSLNSSLFAIIIPKANYTFCEAPTLHFVTHKNCPNILVLPYILPHIWGSVVSLV